MVSLLAGIRDFFGIFGDLWDGLLVSRDVLALVLVSRVEDLTTEYKALPESVQKNSAVFHLYTFKLTSLTGISYQDVEEETAGWFERRLASVVWGVTKVSRDSIMPTLESMMRKKGYTEEQKKDIRDIAASGEFGFSAILGVLFMAGIMPPLMAIEEPAVQKIRNLAWSQMPTMPLSDGELVRLKYLDRLKDLDFDVEMAKLGFSPEMIAAKERNYLFYPSPGDFIRFAVRDVFQQDIVTKYGYDEAFPEDMKEDVLKAGMSMDQLRWYWRAHWELPSTLQGFEMLHRGVIDKGELETLLKIADVAPFWIPKLIDISYRPYSRVDARRMFETGVLDDSDFLRAYQDIGYTLERSQNILEWAKLRKLGPERDLTRSQILAAFRDLEISRDRTIEHMQGLGYDAEESELLVVLEENKSERKELQDLLGVLRDQYANGVMDEKKLESELVSLNFSQTRVAKEMIAARRAFESKIKLPSKEDLSTWFKDGIVDETVYREKMLRLGYILEDVDRYVSGLS